MLKVNVTHYTKSEKVSIQVGKDPSTKTYDIGCKLLSGRLLNILRASSTCNIKVEEQKFHGQRQVIIDQAGKMTTSGEAQLGGEVMVGDRPLIGF